MVESIKILETRGLWMCMSLRCDKLIQELSASRLSKNLEQASWLRVFSLAMDNVSSDTQDNVMNILVQVIDEYRDRQQRKVE